jgi:hypothetical protein
MTAVSERPAVRRGSLLANSAMLSTTAVAVSAANYLLNVGLARMLPPAEFGDVSLVVNIVLVGSLVAATLQLVASKATASAPGERDAVRVVLVRAALVVGAVVLLGLVGGAWLLAGALNASSPWLFVILGAGLPVYFVQAVHRGILQGELRFARLALTYGVEAGVRGRGRHRCRDRRRGVVRRVRPGRSGGAARPGRGGAGHRPGAACGRARGDRPARGPDRGEHG